MTLGRRLHTYLNTTLSLDSGAATGTPTPFFFEQAIPAQQQSQAPEKSMISSLGVSVQNPVEEHLLQGVHGVHRLDTDPQLCQSQSCFTSPMPWDLQITVFPVLL